MRYLPGYGCGTGQATRMGHGIGQGTGTGHATRTVYNKSNIMYSVLKMSKEIYISARLFTRHWTWLWHRYRAGLWNWYRAINSKKNFNLIKSKFLKFPQFKQFEQKHLLYLDMELEPCISQALDTAAVQALGTSAARAQARRTVVELAPHMVGE